MNIRCQTLTEEISNIRIELKTVCDHDTYRLIRKVVHELNAELFKVPSTAKGVKLRELGLTTTPFNDVADPPNSKLVITIPENLTLTDNERSLLSKGLSFIPTRPRGDEYTAKADCESLYRRLRLKAHFHKKENKKEQNENTDQPHTSDQVDDSFQTLKPKTSTWTPPIRRFATLEYYITKCGKEVNQLNFQQRVPKMNLSREEVNVLVALKQRTDIVIKPTDKGGAVVAWDRDLYIQEAERQLSDTNFYQSVDHDLTMEHQAEVISVVEYAITKGEPPASASNLIVDHPRTSRFYLPPRYISQETQGDLSYRHATAPLNSLQLTSTRSLPP